MKTPIVAKLFLAFCIGSFVACVPQKKLEEEQGKRKSCEDELSSLKTKSQDLETQNKEFANQVKDFTEQVMHLSNDTARLGGDNRLMATKYSTLNEVNEKLLDKYNHMMEVNIKDTKKISSELASTQETLLKKQDQLRHLEDSLDVKSRNLDQLKNTLLEREQKLSEMQDILKRKDDAVNELKKKVSDALLGFENKGLTITQKNGKIYVSLEESLLFASGKTSVEKKGAEALKQLAMVLAQNKDINVMVEGHTDNVPMKGTGEIKDNWDLSALRATSIIKILTKDTDVDPKRLIAAGRGEYFPIDASNTPEARKKNRRTEIILTPKLDELFKILESN